MIEKSTQITRPFYSEQFTITIGLWPADAGCEFSSVPILVHRLVDK